MRTKGGDARLFCDLHGQMRGHEPPEHVREVILRAAIPASKTPFSMAGSPTR
jgi:hypothetical protein